jgi:hypothetical protein
MSPRIRSPFAGPFASSQGVRNPRTRGASWPLAPMTLSVPPFFLFLTFTPAGRGGSS